MLLVKHCCIGVLFKSPSGFADYAMSVQHALVVNGNHQLLVMSHSAASDPY